MPTVEERLGAIETDIGIIKAQAIERAHSRNQRHMDEERRLSAIEVKIDKLAEVTQHHVFKATCINGSTKILQGSGLGGGLVAVVFFFGKLLGWW